MRRCLAARAEILRRGHQALAEIGLPDAVHDDARGRRTAPVHQPSGETRSEEHTSELQSLRHLVCRLLLEKKKKKKKNNESSKKEKKKKKKKKKQKTTRNNKNNNKK